MSLGNRHGQPRAVRVRQGHQENGTPPAVVSQFEIFLLRQAALARMSVQQAGGRADHLVGFVIEPGPVREAPAGRVIRPGIGSGIG